jgi:hypothetical protein
MPSQHLARAYVLAQDLVDDSPEPTFTPVDLTRVPLTLNKADPARPGGLFVTPVPPGVGTSKCGDHISVAEVECVSSGSLLGVDVAGWVEFGLAVDDGAAPGGVVDESVMPTA